MAGRGSRHHYALDAKRWQHVRRQALTRDRYRCRSCGRAGRLEVDHILPLRRGGAAYDLANTQALCRACHIAKSAAESRRKPSPARAAWRSLVNELLDPNRPMAG